MRKIMSIGLIVIAILAGIGLLAWLGLQVKPRPFSPLTQPGSVPETVALPQGLPAPVERFFREVYGDRVPVIDSAVISGRAHLRIMGIRFPARFRFTHQVVVRQDIAIG